MLDLYEEVDREIPLKGRRWVISHINVVSPRDIERIARMGLVLTTHTNAYLYKALDATASRLPAEQHDDIVPMNALRDAGVTVSLATDNVPVSLWLPVQQTIVRKDYKIRAAMWARSRRFRVWRRCAAPPRMAPYLTFDEGKKGSLEVGQVRRPRRAERRSADRGGGEDFRDHRADDHGWRQDRARDAGLVWLKVIAVSK